MPKQIISSKPYFQQKLPKKVVLTKRVRVKDKYECQVSLWVPDIPYSKNAPGVGLTMSHGAGDNRQYLRLIFADLKDLRIFMGELNNFILNSLGPVENAFRNALAEWEGMMLKRTTPKSIPQDFHNPFDDVPNNKADELPS
jgi:hypothetical protein